MARHLDLRRRRLAPPRKPGPLVPSVDGYRAWLLGHGYSSSVVTRSLSTLGHLGRWLERKALAVDHLTADAVSGFLAEYRGDRGRLAGASVWPLLEHLRAEGAAPPEPSVVLAPVEQLVGEYSSGCWRPVTEPTRPAR